MDRRGSERFAPLTGLLFLAFAVASFIVGKEPPGTDDSTREVVSFWRDNDVENVISSILAALAAFMLVWFGASLRDSIAPAEAGTGRLARLTFAGTVVAGAGVATNAAVQFALAEAADDASVTTIEALSDLYSGFFFPMTVGFALFLAAAGLAAIRTGVLPRWLGWAQLVGALLLFTPAGFFVFLLTLLWVGAVSVLLFLRQNAPPPPADAAGPPAAAPTG